MRRGHAADDMLSLCSHLEPEEIRAALEYTAWHTQEDELSLT